MSSQWVFDIESPGWAVRFFLFFFVLSTVYFSHGSGRPLLLPFNIYQEAMGQWFLTQISELYLSTRYIGIETSRICPSLHY